MDRQALRNFSVARIKALAVGKRTFVRPADFSPEKYFGKAFGAFVGDGNYRVTIRFSPLVADQVRERFWHESQETKELRDGGIELTMQVGGLSEIQRWVLGWAEHAEVIAPKELKQIILRRAAATVQRYEPTPAATNPGSGYGKPTLNDKT